MAHSGILDKEVKILIHHNISNSPVCSLLTSFIIKAGNGVEGGEALLSLRSFSNDHVN